MSLSDAELQRIDGWWRYAKHVRDEGEDIPQIAQWRWSPTPTSSG